MDRAIVLEGGGLRALVCTLRETAVEAARRHQLAAGSAAALAQAMAGALLLAIHDRARADVQLECNGPLRGLLADAEPDGAVRGLVRVRELAAPEGRFDPRPVLASPHDERAGRLSILRAHPGAPEPQRAAFPFAGADLGGALTLFLRNDRAAGGEMAIEAAVRQGEPMAAGVLIAPLAEADSESVRAFGKPLRQGVLRAIFAEAQDAAALAQKLPFGPLAAVEEIAPRFACRCSRERVLKALRSLGPPELRDMAEKDGGAELTCDFCAANYRVSAGELRDLASG